MQQRESGTGRLLLAVAAPAEALAVHNALGSGEAPSAPWTLIELGYGFDLVITGVGKSNAAGAVARVLDQRRHSAVVSVGVAGALPGSGLAPGATVAASACVFSDEGLCTPGGFLDCAALGFPLGDFAGNSVPVCKNLVERFRPLVDASGPVATVSTCSGTDQLAEQVAARTGALAESMEGAAVALVAVRLGFPAAEVRAISNTTGDRDRQVWDLPKALTSLRTVLGRARAET